MKGAAPHDGPRRVSSSAPSRASPKLVALDAAVQEAPTMPVQTPDGGLYDFRRFSFGEFGTHVSARLLCEVVDALASSIETHSPRADRIVSPEPGGAPWGMALAARTCLPICIVRRRPTGSPDEYELRRRSAYSDEPLYLDVSQPFGRVVVVDDVISSGGTLDSIVRAVVRHGGIVVGAHVILARGTGREKLARRADVPVLSLADFA
jgi:adenine phosphoribosyltransferase